MAKPCLLLFVVVGVVQCLPPLQEYPPDFGASPTEWDFHLGNNANPNTNAQLFATERLPPSLAPKLYRLELRPILEGGTGTGDQFTAPGKLWVTGQAVAAVNEITLNTVNIQIDKASLSVMDDAANTEILVTDGVQDTTKQFYTVQLTSSLTINRNYTLYMEFVSKVNTNLTAGLYISNYTTPDGAMRHMASTDFQAPDARRAFPCFDEPQLKAQWDIEIIRQAHYHTLANMNLVNTMDEPGLDGWVRDTFARTVPMSSYLVCIAVSDFTSEVANSSLYSKPVTVWGPKHLMDKGNGKFSPDFSAKIMKFFEEYYEIEYSLPKMDKISIPDYSSGAMENWGLNTYRDTRLLYEEGISTAQDMFSMTNTISHELVHQWWGNLVTCEWWEDLWIQEGAATYYAPVGVVGVGLGDLLPVETLLTASVQRSLDFDSNKVLTHPIHNVGVDPAGSALFDTLTYHKGAALIRMMNAFLTPSLYNYAMTRFLNQYMYGNADQFQLFQVLDEVYTENPLVTLPENVSTIMYNWTMAPGYPLVRVDRDPVTDTATFTQERFFQRMEDAVDDDSRWFVPISILRQTDANSPTRPERWILANQTSIPVTPVRGEWFIVNPQTHGYYRVLYADSLLDRIISQLMANHTVFDVQVRSALIDDNLNLAYAGYLELQKALNMTLYLRNEVELFPWISFFTNMALPYKMFARSSGFPYFKQYILNLTEMALRTINIEPQGNDTNPRILLRTRLVEWRCNMGDFNCITFANSKFSAWISNPANSSVVAPDLQATVYCTAVANGADAEWDFVWGQYLGSDRDVMQRNLLTALACSKTSFRLNSLMEMALDRNSGILDKHRAVAMQGVAGNSAGVDIAFSFLRNNYDTMVRRYGVSLVSAVVTTLTTQLNNPLDIEDLGKFLAQVPLQLSPAQGENLDKNLRWVTNHLANFTQFAQAIVP